MEKTWQYSSVMKILFLLTGIVIGVIISIFLYKIVVKKAIKKFEKNKRG